MFFCNCFAAICDFDSVHLHIGFLILVLSADVANTDSCAAAYQQVVQEVQDAGLNVLINNAGVNPKANIETITEEAMMNTFKTNTIGPLMLTKVSKRHSYGRTW